MTKACFYEDNFLDVGRSFLVGIWSIGDTQNNKESEMLITSYFAISDGFGIPSKASLTNPGDWDSLCPDVDFSVKC